MKVYRKSESYNPLLSFAYVLALYIRSSLINFFRLDFIVFNYYMVFILIQIIIYLHTYPKGMVDNKSQLFDALTPTKKIDLARREKSRIFNEV